MNLFDAGFDKVLKDMSLRKKAHTNWLNSLKSQRFFVPCWEMGCLIQAERAAECCRKKIAELTNMQDVREACKALETILDQMSIWKYKFATGDGTYDQYSSVYYLSPSGCAIRIKYANTFNDYGFKKEGVVMLIMEKCWFSSYDKELIQRSEKPRHNYSVEELSSFDFNQAIKKGATNYNSLLRRFTDNQNDFMTVCCDESKPHYSHEGHEVQKIFWQR